MEKISKNYTECSKNEKHEFFRISKGRSQDLYWEWSKSLSFYKRSAVEITEVFQSRRLISYDYLLTREIFISTVSIAVISEWHLPSSCCSDSDKRKGEYFWEIDRYTWVIHATIWDEDDMYRSIRSDVESARKWECAHKITSTIEFHRSEIWDDIFYMIFFLCKWNIYTRISRIGDERMFSRNYIDSFLYYSFCEIESTCHKSIGSRRYIFDCHRKWSIDNPESPCIRRSILQYEISI